MTKRHFFANTPCLGQTKMVEVYSSHSIKCSSTLFFQPFRDSVWRCSNSDISDVMLHEVWRSLQKDAWRENCNCSQCSIGHRLCMVQCKRVWPRSIFCSKCELQKRFQYQIKVQKLSSKLRKLFYFLSRMHKKLSLASAVQRQHIYPFFLLILARVKEYSTPHICSCMAWCYRVKRSDCREESYSRVLPCPAFFILKNVYIMTRAIISH